MVGVRASRTAVPVSQMETKEILPIKTCWTLDRRDGSKALLDLRDSNGETSFLQWVMDAGAPDADVEVVS